MTARTPRPRSATREALAELESILDELEDGEVDIDRLAERVRRAAMLLEVCRGRLDEARVEVTRIVAEIDDEPAASGAVPDRDPISTETVDDPGR